jgi:hypothetical protein
MKDKLLRPKEECVCSYTSLMSYLPISSSLPRQLPPPDTCRGQEGEGAEKFTYKKYTRNSHSKNKYIFKTKIILKYLKKKIEKIFK